MLKKIALIAVAITGIFTFAPSMAAENKLFKNYVYDSAISRYTKAAGYYDCSEDVGAVARCIDDVSFLDEKFTLALIFEGEKLSRVVLMGDFEQTLYVKALGGLNKTFTLVSMTDDKSILDLVEIAKKVKTEAEFTARISNYEQLALSSGNLTYTFLEGVSGQNQPNAVTLVMKSPENTRAAELVVFDDEDDESGLWIRFSFPQLEGKKVTEALNKPVEAF